VEADTRIGDFLADGLLKSAHRTKEGGRIGKSNVEIQD
jgi:hypothetical protein